MIRTPIVDRTTWLEIIAEASRAPSAHNAQPARWRIEDDRVELLEDPARRLPHADPTGRDHLIGLGAALEGLALALSRRGMALADIELTDHGATVRIADGATPDPLAFEVERRHTWRRRFAPATERQLAALGALEDIAIARDAEHPARLHDQCAAAFLAQPDYQQELFGWLRFSNDAEDGLTPECLGLSSLESAAARVLFRPGVFSRLASHGWHAPFVSEATRLRTASALLVLHRPVDEHGIETGRRFYRLWLELTRLGLAACPMSALADTPAVAAELQARHRIAHGRRIINVFAIGVATSPAARSARRRVIDIVG